MEIKSLTGNRKERSKYFHRCICLYSAFLLTVKKVVRDESVTIFRLTVYIPSQGYFTGVTVVVAFFSPQLDLSPVF